VVSEEDVPVVVPELTPVDTPAAWDALTETPSDIPLLIPPLTTPALAPIFASWFNPKLTEPPTVLVLLVPEDSPVEVLEDCPSECAVPVVLASPSE
jgi:hypothetical protein